MASERLYVFQHIACEDLGTFAEVLLGRGYRAKYVRLFAGDRIPLDWGDARALIFLGGPMSVNDEAQCPYLAAEKAIIRKALAAHQPILGICLGAQLLAAAAGSAVFPAARREVGWVPVSLTREGHQDPVLSTMAQLTAAFHWHGETFDLPRGAIRLASSALTPNQAFRVDHFAYGLQFHLEVDAAMIDAWMREYPHDLEPDTPASARRIAADTARYAVPLRAAATDALNRFLDLVAANALERTHCPP